MSWIGLDVTFSLSRQWNIDECKTGKKTLIYVLGNQLSFPSVCPRWKRSYVKLALNKLLSWEILWFSFFAEFWKLKEKSAFFLETAAIFLQFSFCFQLHAVLRLFKNKKFVQWLSMKKWKLKLSKLFSFSFFLFSCFLSSSDRLQHIFGSDFSFLELIYKLF